MNERSRTHGLVLSLLIFTLMGCLVSCEPLRPERTELPEAPPRAWIDFPRDGASIPVGASVIVVSHAYAADGVTELLLSVNGTAYRRDPPATSGDTLVEVRQEWIPTEPGLHTLEVRAYDGAGDISGSGSITVRVTGEEIDTPTEVPTSTHTPTPTVVPPPTTVGPTDTHTPTPTHSPTPTIATRTPTLTPTPTPTIVTRTPTSTPTPVPDPPDDTTPPPVPEPFVPADELVIDYTSSQMLAWLPVSDPSFVVYYVRLESQVTTSSWDAVDEWGPLEAKQVEAEVQCGVIYRWSVRAQDGASNSSAWSEWFSFAVNLE